MSERLVESRRMWTHLRMPASKASDELRATADAARAWYEAHGEPWARADVREVRRIGDPREGIVVELEGGVEIRSPLVARGLARIGARHVGVIGASAGARVDEEIDRLWRGDRQSEAWCLAACAVAAVEELRRREVRRLRSEWRERGFGVTPTAAPGYAGWPLEGQRALLGALGEHGPLELTDAFALRPQRSALALVGIGSLRMPGGPGFWHRMRTTRTNQGDRA